ncbi:MAG: penicillin acylase family protein, partial [Boseongicola sp.]|nr:penicillin acylase family protein [Boseongicola sp.]
MVVLLSWLARIAFWLLAFVLSLFLCVWWVLSQSVPDYSVALTVTGIGARVQIVRDVAAVPHVFAETDEDAFFGLGLAHAQDRLWQMTILRRTAQGRLSEIFGSRTLPVDELMRRLDIHALAVASVEAQDAYTRRALDAYAAGVNAWLVQVDAGARGRGAPEFWLFGAGIERWQPGDSIAIGKLMALRLSGHLRDEVLRARLSQVLPKARMRDLFLGTPD